MKLFGLFVLGFALFSVCALSQVPPEDPQAGVLVECGSEKVAIFEHTESQDGCFALGWTIRPNRKKDPVNWTVYNRASPFDMLEKYSNDIENPSQGDYLVVDGILDLQAKTFAPLSVQDPYFPGYNHHGMAVVWSQPHGGSRYAIISNDGRFATAELILASLGSGATRMVDLSANADKAVAARMRKRDPKDYRDYATLYELDNDDGASSSRAEFRANLLTLHFYTGVGKSLVNNDTGMTTFALPEGIVVHINFDKK